jgi:hypothetical protein
VKSWIEVLLITLLLIFFLSVMVAPYVFVIMLPH